MAIKKPHVRTINYVTKVCNFCGTLQVDRNHKTTRFAYQRRVLQPPSEVKKKEQNNANLHGIVRKFKQSITNALS